ncbi:MAG: stage II sporulation protein P [Clostridia bacterium]|nr:stage II sporulation protein P [Clostridia bacterium]
MINLAVISIKDIINLIKKIIFAVIFFCIVCKIFGSIKNGNYVKIEELKTKFVYDYCDIIDQNLLISNYYNNNKIINNSGIKKILVSELSILATEEELMEKENQEEIIEFETINNKNGMEESNNIIESEDDSLNSKKKEEGISNTDIDTVQNNNIAEDILPTKIISQNNKTDTYTDVYKNVKIKNESKYTLTQEMLTPNLEFSNKKDLIIYHTHTCESYTPTDFNNYEATGNFRTTDLNYNVTRVGKELSNLLIDKGFSVTHDVTYHDYPAYTGSYTRSLKTIKNIIANNSSQLVIDLHRDALGSNSSYAPRVQIGEEVAAQLMFVIGTNGGGLEHSKWLNNFKLAIKIQEKANEMYPGLFKPIILRNSRYNQHVTTGACIIEVGATGNTLEECNISMKYLAKVIEKVME